VAQPAGGWWDKPGVRERLLAMAQERGMHLGMTCPDGGNIRAQPKARADQKRAVEPGG
jgi:hypothetical protein